MAISNSFIRKLENIDAVIFDLDGTIVDSMWMWHQIDVEYLGKYGYDCPDDLQNNIEGMTFMETAVYFKNHFKIDDSIEGIMDCWNHMAYEKYANEVKAKPGLCEFVSDLRSKGIRLGIATSNSRLLTLASLSANGIKDYFEVIVTGDECKVGKPKPDIYLEVARLLKIDPSRCMVFEDLPAGITAAKAAGMKSVAIQDDYSIKEWDKKMKMADYFIVDYTEIMGEA